jgi:hypothetical protein
VMKPKPLSALNHLTVPSGMYGSLWRSSRTGTGGPERMHGTLAPTGRVMLAR